MRSVCTWWSSMSLPPSVRREAAAIAPSTILVAASASRRALDRASRSVGSVDGLIARGPIHVLVVQLQPGLPERQEQSWRWLFEAAPSPPAPLPRQRGGGVVLPGKDRGEGVPRATHQAARGMVGAAPVWLWPTTRG